MRPEWSLAEKFIRMNDSKQITHLEECRHQTMGIIATNLVGVFRIKFADKPSQQICVLVFYSSFCYYKQRPP
jgi:hypothetical protein